MTKGLVGLTAAIVLAALSVAAPATAADEKIKLKDASGNVAFAIKPKDDGAKVVDGEDREVVRLKKRGDEIKIKAPDDSVLGFLSGEPVKLKLKDASGADLFVLRRKDDGNYKLETASDALLAKLEKQDGGGWKIEGVGGEKLLKVKVDDGKISLRTPDGDTIYSTKDALRPLAMAALGLPNLTRSQQLALLVRLNEIGE